MRRGTSLCTCRRGCRRRRWRRWRHGSQAGSPRCGGPRSSLCSSSCARWHVYTCASVRTCSLHRAGGWPHVCACTQAMRAPLRPFWVCPESGSSYTPPEAPASTPAAAYLSVVTLCASRVSRHEAKTSATPLPPALCSVQPRGRWLQWLCAAPSPPPLPRRFPVWPRFRWGRRGRGMPSLRAGLCSCATRACACSCSWDAEREREQHSWHYVQGVRRLHIAAACARRPDARSRHPMPPQVLATMRRTGAGG